MWGPDLLRLWRISIRRRRPLGRTADMPLNSQRGEHGMRLFVIGASNAFPRLAGAPAVFTAASGIIRLSP